MGADDKDHPAGDKLDHDEDQQSNTNDEDQPNGRDHLRVSNGDNDVTVISVNGTHDVVYNKSNGIMVNGGTTNAITTNGNMTNGSTNYGTVTNGTNTNGTKPDTVVSNIAEKSLQQENKSKKSWAPSLAACSGLVIHALESFFASHGKRVARRPLMSILLCLVFSAIASSGLYFFDVELRPFKLWLSQSSDFIRLLNWQLDNFPNNVRRHVVIWESENVLTAEAIQEMWRVHQNVRDAVEPSSGKSWAEVCSLLPSFNVGAEEKHVEEEWELGVLKFRRKRDLDIRNDISIAVSRNSYCDLIENMPSYCHENSLLEVWGYKNDVIMNLTDAKVIDDVNKAALSEVFGYKLDVSRYLGGVKKDENGTIISADAAQHVWMTNVDQDAVKRDVSQVDTGSGQVVDKDSMAWESVWLNVVLDETSRPASVNLYANAARSFGNVSDESIWGDVTFLMVGLMLMFVFINITLGRRNHVEQRPLLSLFGLISVALSVVSAYGICSVMGIKYSPVNSILPLLLLGLGVDDMFIILAMWDARKNNTSSNKVKANDSEDFDENLETRAHETMKHAGVAITATSLTDVMAFGIGASTELPALRGFCIYAAFGILIVFVFQSTFFLACLVLDEQRLKKNRNGLLWCFEHKNWNPTSCSKVDVLNKAFEWYGKVVVKRFVRYFIIVLTAILIILSIAGCLNLHREFNPMWFIPTDSYLTHYFDARDHHFASEGAFSFIYFSNVSMSKNLGSLQNLTRDFKNADSVLTVDNWFKTLEEYIVVSHEFPNKTINDNLISDAISLFLESPSGARFRDEIVFDGSISCNEPAPPIVHFRMGFMHKSITYATEQIEAKGRITEVLDKYNIPGLEGVWSEAYSIWETNAIVGKELMRNLLLAGLVVAVMTVLLLVSLRAALFVLVCVAASVAGVGGSMYISDVAVDTVSCISLVLCIGLSVDYAMHIAHAFLVTKGTERRERVSDALAKVGPAVFQGGVSTLIPFVMLYFSNSHVFKTFFAVFTPATIFGLYYALVLLPVLLYYFGPEHYHEEQQHEEVRHSPPSNGVVNQTFTMSTEQVNGTVK